MLGPTETTDCIDVVVIGGGVGGAYTGWRLRDRGLSISVFEYSDRVGGRLFTAELPVAPGTYLDFGAMRFLEKHSILLDAANEIGLQIVPFDVHGERDHAHWYLRETHLSSADLGGRNTPYNLNPDERKNPEVLVWDVFTNNTNIASIKFPDEMYTLTTNDGVPVYRMSQLNFYSQYATMEAFRYLQGSLDWYIDEQRTPLHGLKWTNTPSSSVRTIQGGMGKLPTTLMDRFLQASNSHKLHLNHQLMRMERRQTGGYILRFRKTHTIDGVTTPFTSDGNEVTICARKVILAIPKNCLVKVDFPAFRNNPVIMDSIDSVFEFPAGKIFLAYPYKWWKTVYPDCGTANSDLPCRHTIDWFPGDNGVAVILASYHTGEATTRYWRELSQFGTPIPGSLPGANAVTDVVKTRVEKYLSLIFDVSQSDIPEALGGGMMLWDSFPFEAAFHVYKPGFRDDEVADMMMKPSPSDDVYVVSNSWAEDHLGYWAEGTLQTVDKVLNKYFSV